MYESSDGDYMVTSKEMNDVDNISIQNVMECVEDSVFSLPLSS